MNIGSVGTTQPLEAASGLEDKRLQFQVALLKKVLEAQQDQAAELQKMAEGKGQVLDLRV